MGYNMKMTEDQQYCSDMLTQLVGKNDTPLKILHYGSGVYMLYGGRLSTYDTDKLTSLVLFAFQYGIRIEIESVRSGMFGIIAHKRIKGFPEGSTVSNRHPSLLDLCNRINLKLKRRKEEIE